MWTLVQVVFNLVMAVVGINLWLRSRRPPQDDPRLSRGLQLLQTKITVLEDLSDRTEAQVKQLTSMLDQKNRILQNKILEAEQQILKIDHSMNKSLEVAEIFQDKIPHTEILERQRTVEYVKAARMANSGMGVEDIMNAVHLPREQVELIAKFNRDQLMFDETQLPGWASKGIVDPSEMAHDPSFALGQIDFVGGLEKPKADNDGVSRIESGFRAAVAQHREAQAHPIPTTFMETKVGETLQPAVMSIKATAQTLKDRLVSSAEELLRSQASQNSQTAQSQIQAIQQQPAAAPREPAVKHAVVKAAVAAEQRLQQPLVRKVVFPRIEK